MSDRIISPAAFYTDRIPAQFNQTLESRRDADRGSPILESMEAVNATVCVVVKGEKGGHFNLNIAAGRMSAAETPSHQPFMTLIHDLDSFAVLVRESGDSILGFLAGLTGLQDEMVLTCERTENLAGLNGALQFELIGEAGFSLIGHFGRSSPGEQVDCTVRLTTDTYHELKAGALSPEDAFLGGRVEVEGDMEMAIALALTALSTD